MCQSDMVLKGCCVGTEIICQLYRKTSPFIRVDLWHIWGLVTIFFSLTLSYTWHRTGKCLSHHCRSQPFFPEQQGTGRQVPLLYTGCLHHLGHKVSVDPFRGCHAECFVDLPCASHFYLSTEVSALRPPFLLSAQRYSWDSFAHLCLERVQEMSFLRTWDDQ